MELAAGRAMLSATKPARPVSETPRGAPWVQGGRAALVFLGLVLAENVHPARPRREPRLLRWVRNGIIAASSALVVSLVEQPLVRRVSGWTQRRRFGVLRLIDLEPSAELLLGVVALDYSLYWWHRLTHEWPWLWRMHRIHHADRDLDASTALRFHAGEMLASVPWRLTQVLVLGASPRVVSVWQTCLLVSIAFHHSNLRLPKRLESVLSWFVMTPQLHAIHHSRVAAHQAGNFSSGLTVWDRVHRTLGRPVDEPIAIGVEGYAAGDVTLGRMLLLTSPHRPINASWGGA